MDVAQIGFSADTSELVEAKAALNGLVPAADRAERASDRLNKMMLAGSKAALAAARADVEKANAVLSAAKASDTASKSDIAAAASAKRKAQASYDAAKAATAQRAASEAAAASAKKEAAALNAAATASDRYSASAGKRTSVPSVGAGNRHGNDVTPWGKPTADNDNLQQSAGAMKANVGNIAAQFQDIGVTAAMGMNPLLIALQQGTQLSMAMGGGVRSLVAALATVFSPVALLTIAVVALIAAGIQMVEWASLAQWGLNALAGILPQVATGIALVGTAITIAFAPAILTAFWNLFILVAAGIVGSVGAIIAAVGAIPLAIGLIIADLYIFRDEWTQVLGVDLIGAAKTGVNYIIGAFVGAYNDIVFLWQQFPAIIGGAAIGAANMAIKAVNAIIAASVAGLNSLIQAVNKIGAVGESLGIGGFAIGEVEAPQFDTIANDAAASLEGAVKNRNAALKEALAKDYLGAIGGAVTDAATQAGAKLKEFSAGLTVDDAKKKKGGGGGAGGATEGEKFEDIVAGAERTIATLQAERDAIGLTAEATARLKYETDLLNQAQQKNIQLTPEQRSQLLGLAADMANLEAETSRAKDALDFAKDATKGFVSDLVGGLRQGKSLWEAFGDAANNALDKIIDKLLNQFIDAIFTTNSAASSLGGGAGGGGFLSSLLGGFGALFGFAKGGAFPNGISAHSNSVVDKPTLFAFASGAGVMGEAGPEAIMPLKRGPDGSLGVQMHGGSQSSGGDSTIVIAPVMNFEGGSSGNAAQDEKQAARISDAVMDAIGAIVDERILRSNSYGGALNPRGFTNG